MIFICSLMGDTDDANKYPPWAISVGWVLTASSLVCIPVYIIYKFFITSGNCSEVRLLCDAERASHFGKAEHAFESDGLTNTGSLLLSFRSESS